jgi:hypothetical protein
LSARSAGTGCGHRPRSATHRACFENGAAEVNRTLDPVLTNRRGSADHVDVLGAFCDISVPHMFHGFGYASIGAITGEHVLLTSSCVGWYVDDQMAEGSMRSWFLALIAGPLIIIVLGFVLMGEGGAYVAFFGGFAALVFIAIFGPLAAILRIRSLLVLVLLANLVPFGFWAMNCMGKSCPNYVLEAAAPQYAAATFCAVIFWLVMRRFAKPTISLSVPVETVDGKLVLLIPLAVGGSELAPLTQGMGEIDGDFLKVTIPDWLAIKMGVQSGSKVCVDNTGGRFNMVRDDDGS